MHLIVAIHRGPYLTLAPLEKELDCRFVLDETAAAQRGRDFLSPPSDWGALLRRLRPKSIIRGISKTPAARNHETRATEAAAQLGIPVYAVEDFPGNYQQRGGEPVAGIFVEYDYCRRLHAKRGVDPRTIHVVGNPRYASLPSRPHESVLRRRRAAWGGKGPFVLWAGQPHGAPCRATLRALRPAFEELGVTLLLRRHPLDRSGPYPYGVDISAEPDAFEAAAAADLVVTQFSTLAIEAGFVGTPGLLAVLPGIGDDYLRRMAGGQERTPWGVEGCAFELRDPRKAKALLKTALFNERARNKALSKLTALRRDSAKAAARIAAQLSR